jgi:hypothetical protein
MSTLGSLPEQSWHTGARQYILFKRMAEWDLLLFAQFLSRWTCVIIPGEQGLVSFLRTSNKKIKWIKA